MCDKINLFKFNLVGNLRYSLLYGIQKTELQKLQYFKQSQVKRKYVRNFWGMLTSKYSD